ncbi:MAG: hypothetical protein Q8Q08_08745 [Candidatus Omnitrophota bacterium]|nr:hypothetical protein [Candidatus Omnitrophota bacterium]
MKLLVLSLSTVQLVFVTILCAAEGVHVFDIVDLGMYLVLFLTPAATLVYLLKSEKTIAS